MKGLQLSDVIKLDPLPQGATRFPTWRHRSRFKILSASNLPTSAIFDWIMEIEQRSVSFEALGEDAKHPVLNAKIGAAVQQILHGALGQEITIKIEEKIKETGLPLTDRQQLRLVYESYATEAEEGAMYNREDLYRLRLQNDDLVRFRNGLNALLAGMDPDAKIGTDELEFLARRQLRHSKTLAFGMMLYHKAEKGDPVRTLDYLFKILDKAINLQRKEGNRQDTSKVDPTRILRPDGDGRPKATAASKGNEKSNGPAGLI